MDLDFSFEGTKMRIIQSISASVVPVEYDPKIHIKPKGSSSKVSLIRAALEDSTEPNTKVFVVSSVGQVVGALSVKIPSKKQAEILHLGSTLSGVGTILVNHCLKLLKKSGVKSVVLEAYSNTEAGKFYEKLGFSRIGDTDTFTKEIK